MNAGQSRHPSPLSTLDIQTPSTPPRQSPFSRCCLCRMNAVLPTCRFYSAGGQQYQLPLKLRNSRLPFVIAFLFHCRKEMLTTAICLESQGNDFLVFCVPHIKSKKNLLLVNIYITSVFRRTLFYSHLQLLIATVIN